ncbi:MAG TPA: hypothetical protein VJR05_11375, partial [Acidimicrobiia bacterium]|nr:hypothetical protein [Acidimicrobiia bacterium]
MGWVQVELLKQQAASAGVAIDTELGTPWRRLQDALGQRQQMVANLLRQIEHHHAAVVDLQGEVHRLSTEMEGLHKTQEALLADLLQRRTIDDDLFWSPYPILG